ncbi:hypothetical protein FHW69_001422 [Luteibacter sp. Sphag1AF]|uniref:hypothetical protein n=1 Tax=Luteibacter sp. Sphag1AF TaxID=2587031 RepID=UPI00161CCC92|nr:hypothetical protein [Luteibacter sp. Sphag1AF]MBB3226821.1 hypothetical protein [Luteibacter sp. Sphag1AF]
MDWGAIITDNASTTAVGLLIVLVSFNRYLGMIWPLALVMPWVPVLATAYAGYPVTVFFWSYVPLGMAVYIRIKVGAFPRQ